MSVFVKAICAGICISLGCIAFLMSPDKLSGSVLFSVGLLGVVVHKLKLFTGSVCSIKFKDFDREVLTQGLILFGNIVGATIAGWLFFYTGIETDVMTIAINKLSASWEVVLSKAIFCNILICLAVDEWQKQKNSLMVIFAVTVFVLCGFEHCIANTFYMIASVGKFYLNFFIVNVIGNAIGGIVFWRLKHMFDEEEE